MSNVTNEETSEETNEEPQAAGRLSLEVTAVIPLGAILNNDDAPQAALVMCADGSVRWIATDNVEEAE